MRAHNRWLIEFFTKSGRFVSVFELDGFVFVTVRLCDLTAFGSPSIRRKSGLQVMDYDLGITVLESGLHSESELRSNLMSCKYLSLPKTVPTRNSLDRIVSETGLSDWLMQDIVSNLRKYSLHLNDALFLVNEKKDDVMNRYMEVYGDEFEDVIARPLLRIRKRIGH